MLKFYSLLLSSFFFISFVSVANESNLLFVSGSCYKNNDICERIDYDDKLIKKTSPEEIDFELFINSKNKKYINKSENNNQFEHVLLVYNQLSSGDDVENAEIIKTIELLKEDIKQRQLLISMITEDKYDKDILMNSVELTYMEKQVAYLNLLNNQNEKLKLVYKEIEHFYPQDKNSVLEKELNLQSENINQAYQTIVDALEFDINMSHQLIHFFEILNNEVK
jgi:hypothetical protein